MSLAITLAAMSLAACGGGGGSGAGIAALPQTGGSIMVSVTAVIGSTTSGSSVRTAASSSIQSVKIVATNAGVVTQAISNCTTSCSLNLQVTPGTVRFDGTLYGGQNATGSTIATGSTTANVVAGQVNQVNLSFTSASAPAPGGGNYAAAGWPQWSSANVMLQKLDSRNPAAHIASWSSSANSYYNSHGYGMGNWSSQFPLLIGNADDGGMPVYLAKTSDPAVTINCTAWSCPSLQGLTVHIPSDAVPGQAYSGSDKQMVVVDPNGRYTYEFYQAGNVLSSGNISSGEKFDTYTSTAWAQSYDGAVDNGHVSLISGMVSAQDLLQGSINHAVLIGSPCSTGTVYPSIATPDVYCGGGSGAPVGARLWLNLTDSQVDAAVSDPVQRMVAKALIHYGGFVHDTTASSQWMVRRTGAQRDPDKSAWASAAAKYGIPTDGSRIWIPDGWPSAISSQFVWLDPCVTQLSC